MAKLSTYKTAWYGDNDNGSVIYTNTNIVDWDEDSIKLNSDGWQTVTTKKKMNQTSEMFGLDFQVFQKDFDWFVRLPNGSIVDYCDGLEISRR